MLMKIVGIFVAVVLVSSAGVAAYAAYDLTASFTEDAVDLEGQEAVPPDIGAIEGGVNLFVAGTDECLPEYAGYFGDRCTGEDAEANSTTSTARPHLRRAAPRDGHLVPARPDGRRSRPARARTAPRPRAPSKDQINSVFTEGGLHCVVKTISQLSGHDHPVRREGQLRAA